MLADADEEAAAANAVALGYARHTGDWRTLVSDPAIDIVAVAAPNAPHEPIVLAVLKHGKTALYCEKPLSTTAASALKMTEAVEAAGALTIVGFGFLRNPAIEFARKIVSSGEIGEITGFRGRHAENYMADADVPHSFRTDPEGGGAMFDIGSHIVSMARYLAGPIIEVCAESRTIHRTRPIAPGAAERRSVEVDDMTHALLRFGNGAAGSIEANWAATARTLDLSFEITGKKGAIAFTQERMNELMLYKSAAPERSGYTKIEIGPAHPPYGQFCPAPGHQLGFNDLKVIEAAEFLRAYADGGCLYPDFREAYEVQCTVEAMRISSRSGGWEPVAPEPRKT